MKSSLTMFVSVLAIFVTGIGCKNRITNDSNQLRDIELIPPSNAGVQNFSVIQEKSHQDPSIHLGFERHMPITIRGEFDIDKSTAQLRLGFPKKSAIEEHLWDIKINGVGRCLMKEGKIVIAVRPNSDSNRKSSRKKIGFECEIFSNAADQVTAVFAELPSSEMVIQVNVKNELAVYYVKQLQ